MEQLLHGEQAGIAAISFALGCAATWGFMERVVYRERVKRLEDRIRVLEDKAQEYDDLMKGLASAQLSKLERAGG